MTNSEIIEQWINQYKQDEEISVGQAAAIAAIERILQLVSVDESHLSTTLEHVHRMTQILQAFGGRLYLLKMQNDFLVDD